MTQMTEKSYIVLKTEKLSAALYLITGYMSDREPLKWQLRHWAAKSVAVAPADDYLSPQKLLLAITKIMALIDLALHSESASKMNFSLLRKEYALLSSLISGEAIKNLEQSIKVAAPIGNRLPIEAGRTEAVRDNLPSSPDLIMSDSDLSNKLSDKQERQDLLVSYLQGKGWLPIKDIAAILPGFSLKTVQRELTELVDKGLLKKRGERRWSRYSLTS